MVNLDMKCAKSGRELIRDLSGQSAEKEENVVQKALGVLLENGPYAMYLFCKSKKYYAVNKCINNLFKEDAIQLGAGNELEERLESIADDLETLLFARDLMERTLTYARYHAKAIV